MRKILVSLFVYMFYVNAIFSQADSKILKPYENRLYFALGPVHSRLIDQGYTESKLLFSGTNTKLVFGYERETSKSILGFSVGGSVGNIHSENSHLPSQFFTILPYLEYLFKFGKHHDTRKKNEFFAGIYAASNNLFLQNEPVIDNIDIVSLHGLYVDLTERINLPKQYIQFSCLLPAIIYTNRVLWRGGASNYGYDDKDHPVKTLFMNGTYSYFDPWHNLELKIDYILMIGKHTDFTARYRFLFINKYEQVPYRIYSNEVLAGLDFNF